MPFHITVSHLAQDSRPVPGCRFAVQPGFSHPHPEERFKRFHVQKVQNVGSVGQVEGLIVVRVLFVGFSLKIER